MAWLRARPFAACSKNAQVNPILQITYSMVSRSVVHGLKCRVLLGMTQRVPLGCVHQIPIVTQILMDIVQAIGAGS